MIRRLFLDIPITRGSTFAWERNVAGGYDVTRNGRRVYRCDAEEEARDQADSMNREVMRLITKPMTAASVTVTGDALRSKAQQDIADLYGV